MFYNINILKINLTFLKKRNIFETENKKVYVSIKSHLINNKAGRER